MDFYRGGPYAPPAVSKEWDPEDVFDVLASDVARDILVLASDGPRSADELASDCDASLPTIYRRVNALLEYDLLAARRRFDDDGHHYQTFQTAIEGITVDVDESGVAAETEPCDDLVGRFEAFWTDLGSTGEGSGRREARGAGED